MAYLSSAVDDLRRRVRDAKYRNQLKNKYTFIKAFRGGRVYFTDIIFAEYVVKGMVLDTDKKIITQVKGNPRHPHATTEHDLSIGFCGNLYQLREFLSLNNLEDAIVEAFRIIASYNPYGAVRRPPKSMVCFACCEIVRDQFYDYQITDLPDAHSPGVYYAGRTQYVIYHDSCHRQLNEKLSQIRRDKHGIPRSKS